MVYIRVDNNKGGTITEVGQSDFLDLLPNESSYQTNFEFPTSQPVYFYRYSGGTIIVNTEYNIENLDYPNHFKIYDFIDNSDGVDKTRAPYEIDYTLLGLHKKREFVKGELRKTKYYENYNVTADTYSNLVLCEHRTYYRVNQMVHRREMEICWIKAGGTNWTGGTDLNEDGEIVGAKKYTTKFYTPNESIAAGERRRRTIISNVKIGTLYLLQVATGRDRATAEADGFTFLAEIKDDITLYVEGVLDPLKNSIMTNNNHAWLDAPIDGQGTRIRDYLYNEVDIDYTINNVNT